jgi:hypothetical protein
LPHCKTLYYQQWIPTFAQKAATLLGCYRGSSRNHRHHFSQQQHHHHYSEPSAEAPAAADQDYWRVSQQLDQQQFYNDVCSTLASLRSLSQRLVPPVRISSIMHQHHHSNNNDNFLHGLTFQVNLIILALNANWEVSLLPTISSKFRLDRGHGLARYN